MHVPDPSLPALLAEHEHRGRSVEESAVAELAVLVVAPAISHIAGGEYRRLGSEQEEPELVYFKPFWQQDSIVTVRLDPADLPAVVRANRTPEGVAEVMRRATLLARQWAVAAPGVAQPFFILRDLRMEQHLYEVALEEHEHALRLLQNTTDRDLIELGILNLATGAYDSALSVTKAGLALGVRGRTPYAAAGGVFIGLGMPHEAIGLIGSHYDEVDRFIPTNEGNIPFGDSQPLSKRIQILGSAGVTGNELRHAFDSLGAFWFAKYDGAELELLHCTVTTYVAAALVRLGPDDARRWVGHFGDPVPERCRMDATVQAIELFAGLGPGAGRSTGARNVEAAVAR